MEPSDFQNTRSPRRELQLQGPRPAPLKVRKDSYKIRKPPVPPQQQQYHQNPQPQQQQQQIRPPVIIYTVSPKVIHTNPSEFMTLVQRLTGSGSGSSSSTNQDHHHQSGAISPAARLASIEKTKLEREKKQREEEKEQEQLSSFVEGIENIERSNLFPGILSPGPTSLPVISPNFFSPPSDPNMINMFHDLSPIMHGNRNFIEGSFMPSPSTSFISPRFFTSSSPTTPSVDLFNNFFYN